MNRLRAILFVLVLACGICAGGGVPQQVAAAAPVALERATTAEDAPTQSKALGEAYNLLLNNYVHPLNTSALLQAAWSNLVQEAAGRAATPGPSPSFSGNRAADLRALQGALTAYLAQPGSSPDGFTAAHALIRGMVRFVDENHTFFLDPQQYHDYQSWSRGDDSYIGVGMSLTTRDSQPRIVEVYDGTPAQQVGLQSGDILVSIADQSVDGMALDQLSSLVRGPAGSSVPIVVRRGADPTQIQYVVQRALIHLQFVSDKVVQDDIGYVLLRGFPEPSVIDSIEQDIATFQTEGVHGLILDLRGNAGGRIDVGTRLLGDFLPNGTSIYQEVDRGGHDSTYATHGGSQYSLPLVVLVDGGTASMGEIFASAVQEHGAAIVLGSTTSGSVAAAEVFGLSDGSGLQVTAYDILSADGKPLNKVGVVPDEVVQADSSADTDGTDPVLDRAVALLQDQIAATSGA
jgi:carboxyl-terminal processing protease